MYDLHIGIQLPKEMSSNDSADSLDGNADSLGNTDSLDDNAESVNNSESLNLSSSRDGSNDDPETPKGAEGLSGVETSAGSVSEATTNVLEAAASVLEATKKEVEVAGVEFSRSNSRKGSRKNRGFSSTSRRSGSGIDLGSQSYSNINAKSGSTSDRPVVKRSADGSLVKYQGCLKQSKSW